MMHETWKPLDDRLKALGIHIEVGDTNWTDIIVEALEAARDDAMEAEAYAEELEAKLAKAVETLKRYGGVMPIAFAPIQDGGYKARTTITELTGGKDE